MDGSKVEIKGDMNGLKSDMEGLTKLLQEMIPNGEKVVQETNDENKLNVNRDFKNSNFGLKTHHIPNIDIWNFYGKDLVRWILQMKQYFDHHNVQNTQKVRIATLPLEKNTFVWYHGFSPVKKLSLGQFLRRK